MGDESSILEEKGIEAEKYKPSEVEDVTERDSLQEQEKDKNKAPPVQPYKPTIPYPERLRKSRDQEQFGKFLDLFKQLHINIPFVEAFA